MVGSLCLGTASGHYLAPLLGTGETTLGVQGGGLGSWQRKDSDVQDIVHWKVPVIIGAGAEDKKGEAENAGLVQPGDEEGKEVRTRTEIGDVTVVCTLMGGCSGDRALMQVPERLRSLHSRRRSNLSGKRPKVPVHLHGSIKP